MTKFEYLVETVRLDMIASDDEDLELMKHLDDRGTQCWELVEFKRTKDNRFRMIFKRAMG